MTSIVGRNVKVEVALTFAASIAPTAVTKAYPPVATLTSHSLVDGDAGYWVVTAGMVELDAQGFLVDNKATNTWEMPGLDSTDYSTYTAGTAYAAATWGTISESTSYNIGGGAAEQLDDTRLLSIKTSNIAGNLAAQDVSIDIKAAEISGAAMQFVERQALRGLKCLFKVSKGSQVLRVFYGTPSLPGESVSAGAIGTGQFSVTVPAFAIKPNV
jgi:hypothetical protein